MMSPASLFQLICILLGVGIGLFFVLHGLVAVWNYYLRGNRKLNICKKLFVAQGGAFLGSLIMGISLMITDIRGFLIVFVILMIAFGIVSPLSYIFICLPGKLRK